MGYDRIRPSPDIESNLKSGIVRGGRSSAEYRTFIEETLTHSPKAQVIWAHWCGQSTPEDAKKLLTRFSNLTCELAWLHKPMDYVATRLVDENKQFVEGWKKVIGDFQTTSSSAWIHR